MALMKLVIDSLFVLKGATLSTVAVVMTATLLMLVRGPCVTAVGSPWFTLCLEHINLNLFAVVSLADEAMMAMVVNSSLMLDGIEQLQWLW